MTETTASPNRPQFKLSGTAEVKHLNIRKEGEEDSKVLACDIKIVVSKVDRKICDYFDDALQSFLWRGDTESMIVRAPHMNDVSFFTTVENATIKLGKLEYIGDVKKFSLSPADGGVVTMVFSVTVQPSANDMPELSKLVGECDIIEITGQKDLFDAPTETTGDTK